MHRRGLLARGLDEGVDDVRRRRDVGIAAAEIDQRLAGLGRHGCDAREQRREVLLRERFDPVGAWTHDPMLRGSRGSPIWATSRVGMRATLDAGCFLAAHLSTPARHLFDWRYLG